jgi:hypothetical protein
MPILNPMIWMNWVKKHWEEHYIQMAEVTVQDMVCLKFIRQHLLK